MERWIKGILLTLALTAMILSNKFISLGQVQRLLDLAELIFLVFAVLKLSGYTRGELGLGGEFSLAKHALFPFVFFMLPLTAVVFVPHNSVPPWKFALYFLNFMLIAALVGNSMLFWFAHFTAGLNASQLIAALMLSAYRLTFRRIEPLIIVHALWDATFIVLKPRLVGSSALLIILPLLTGTLLSLGIFFVTDKNGVVS